MKYLIFLLLISVTHVSPSFADSATAMDRKILTRLCDERPRSYDEIFSLYRKGMFSLELFKEKGLRQCISKVFKKSHSLIHYCKLMRALGKNPNSCREFQDYAISPASSDDLIDLMITSKDSSDKRLSHGLMMITEELSLIKMPENSELAETSDADTFYRLVSFSNGRINLYLDPQSDYQLFNRLTGKRQVLKVDTYLESAQVTTAHQMGVSVEGSASTPNFDHSLSQSLSQSFSRSVSKHKWVIGGSLLVVGAIVTTILLTSEPEIQTDSFTTSD